MHHTVIPGFVDIPRWSDGAAGQMERYAGWWTKSRMIGLPHKQGSSEWVDNNNISSSAISTSTALITFSHHFSSSLFLITFPHHLSSSLFLITFPHHMSITSHTTTSNDSCDRLNSRQLSQVFTRCCLPTPMTLASGGSPIFPLVVHQPAFPSIWPAVHSLRRGLSTNAGVTI